MRILLLCGGILRRVEPVFGYGVDGVMQDVCQGLVIVAVFREGVANIINDVCDGEGLVDGIVE